MRGAITYRETVIMCIQTAYIRAAILKGSISPQLEVSFKVAKMLEERRFPWLMQAHNRCRPHYLKRYK